MSTEVKSMFARPTYHVEGAGNADYSMPSLIATLAVVPLAICQIARLSWWSYPVVFALTALPTFAAYNVWWVQYAKPVRPQKGLPQQPLTTYFDFRDAGLAAKYASGQTMPMETWCEAYFDQKVDVKGDFMQVFEARHDWAYFNFTVGLAKFFVTQWIPELLWHSRIQDESQVRDHYDRGDDFYAAFLGPMMIYTSGITNQPNGFESLEQMQLNKLNDVAEKICLKAGDRVLDLGCGWGTWSVHAAKQGAHVTGITLGRNQHQYCMNKAAEAGVADKVEILCMDYRDTPKRTFDKITCLEMSEHVGVLRYQAFLRQVYDMLDDDGIFYLQIAGLRRAWQYEDLVWGLFMAKYIFPGADASPPLNWVVEQCERAGFEVRLVETMGVHYSATLYHWYKNWMANRAQMSEKYGERLCRVWDVFLAWATIVARQGSATCYQLVLHKNLNAFDRTKLIHLRKNVTA